MIAKAKEAVCLIPGCDRLAVTRGLCASCYQAARKAVGRDATTWDEIAELGLAARKITAESLFMSELRKRREAKGLKKSKGATKRRGARR